MINIGVIGAGHIAEAFSYTITRMDTVCAKAIASRTLEKAEKFKNEYGYEKAYGSYDELYNDPEIDLIYVATPHNCHYEQAKSALLNGKHVLMEKAFTLTYEEAAELVSISEEKGLFLEEAMMTRYMPLTTTLKCVLKEGVIGEVKSLTANYCYPLTHKERVMSKELGGGGLLDIGVYPLAISSMIFGQKVKDIKATIIWTESGVDAEDFITIRMDNDQVSTIKVSITSSTHRDAVINGTDGYLIIRDVNELARIERYNKNKEWVETYDKPEQISNLEHEVRAAVAAIEAGKTYADEYTHEELLKEIKIREAVLAAGR